MAAVERSGYVVDPIASSLRSGRSAIVNVLVPSLRSPHFANAAQGILDAFETSRYQLVFTQTGYREDLRARIVGSVLPFRPAALVFAGTLADDSSRDLVRGLGIPIVEIWGDEDDALDIVVGNSAARSGELLGRHFGEQGFRHIAYCGHTRQRGGIRLAAFRDALHAQGRTLDFVLPFEGVRVFSDGVSAFREILRALPECDAILFGSDVLAAGALVAAHQAGMDVPGRIAIAGIGDLDFAAHTTPSLTSLDMADHRVGRIAADLLLKRLDGEVPPQHIIQLPVVLKARESTQRR